MCKLIASLVAVLVMVGTAETATAKSPTYRQKVVAGTYSYGPCKSLRKSQEGRTAYWDMVADNTDEGKRRTVKAQVQYVRQGCRNGI
jgi:hypothetical protein